jgi:hypothetical protein
MHLLQLLMKSLGLMSMLPLLNAQLNPADAPCTTYSAHGLNDYEQIVSACHLNTYCSDTKQWDLVHQVFTRDAVASFSADSNLSVGIEAINYVNVHGTAGFITQHLLSNFCMGITTTSL